MTGSNPTLGEEPKKKSLKLLLRSKPVAEVDMSAGRIYLYPLRVRDMTDFVKLEPAGAVDQLRKFLTSIGSLHAESDEASERISLDSETAKRLSDDEIERLAKAYVESSAWQSVRQGSQERKSVPREADETASAYLIRLLKNEVEHHDQNAKQLYEKRLGFGSGIFDQVRKSYTELGSTVKQFESLARPALAPSLSDAHLEINNHIVQHSARMASERAEELEMVRLTGKMTAESAKMLKDLAEAATTLMEQFDERDRKADKSTRKQITIAVWSVGISAVFALLALIVSGFAYVQDKENNESGDKWQAELITVVTDGIKKQVAAEEETQRLRNKVAELEAKVSNFESARASSRSSKTGESAARRETKPVSNLPPYKSGAAVPSPQQTSLAN